MLDPSGNVILMYGTVSTPVVHALLDQASKTYSSSQYPSVSQSALLSTFEMNSPFEFQGKSRNTLLFLRFFIGIVPGERFVKACKVKSAGASTFTICVDGLIFFLLKLVKYIKFWPVSMKLHTSTLPVLKIIVRDLKGAICPRIQLQKAVHYPENSF
jgi:hypothetical protein